MQASPSYGMTDSAYVQQVQWFFKLVEAARCNTMYTAVMFQPGWLPLVSVLLPGLRSYWKLV
jgi:hypothetical protein